MDILDRARHGVFLTKAQLSMEVMSIKTSIFGAAGLASSAVLTAHLRALRDSTSLSVNTDCVGVLHFLNSMMMAVILSAPRPSVVCRLGGQFTSIIISTMVASP